MNNTANHIGDIPLALIIIGLAAWAVCIIIKRQANEP
jgi:sialic acid synthase SpsE